MTPKSGKSCSLVDPTAPEEAFEADEADPGEVSETKAREREIEQGKYGEQKLKPFKPNPEETAWIEIELVDEAGHPIPGEIYKVTMPDGRGYKGSLNNHGWTRIEGFKPGQCKISFPRLDADAWEFIESLGAKGGGA